MREARDVEKKPRRILRSWHVMAMTGLTRHQIKHREEMLLFPRSFKLGDRALGWYEHEILEWIEEDKVDRERQAAEKAEAARIRAAEKRTRDAKRPRPLPFDWKRPATQDLPDGLAPFQRYLRPLSTGHGAIYFLMKGRDVMYVGQSISVVARVMSHRREKEFDDVLYVSFPRRRLNEAERWFIRHLNPPWNRAWKAVGA